MNGHVRRTGGLYTEVFTIVVLYYTEGLYCSGVDIVNGHLGQVVSIHRCSTIVELIS